MTYLAKFHKTSFLQYYIFTHIGLGFELIFNFLWHIGVSHFKKSKKKKKTYIFATWLRYNFCDVLISCSHFAPSKESDTWNSWVFYPFVFSLKWWLIVLKKKWKMKTINLELGLSAKK